MGEWDGERDSVEVEEGEGEIVKGGVVGMELRETDEDLVEVHERVGEEVSDGDEEVLICVLGVVVAVWECEEDVREECVGGPDVVTDTETRGVSVPRVLVEEEGEPVGVFEENEVGVEDAVVDRVNGGDGECVGVENAEEVELTVTLESPDWLGVCESEEVMEKLKVPLDEDEGVAVYVGVIEDVEDCVEQVEALPQGVGVAVEVGEREGRGPLCVGETVEVVQVLEETVPVKEAVREKNADMEGRGLRVELCVADTVGEPDRETEVDRVNDGDGVLEGEVDGLLKSEPVGVTLGVRVGEAELHPVRVILGVTVGEMDEEEQYEGVRD